MDLREHLELKLLKNGNIALDEVSARLLYLIEQYGSILSASRSLGISYSTAWDLLVKIENAVGEKIIETRRGARGGARLTEAGKQLLRKYFTLYRKYFHKDFTVESPSGIIKQHVNIYAGSHDILVNHLIGLMVKKGYYIENNWIGSLMGLSSVILGEADIAGIHLLDPDSNQYNIPIIKKYSGSAEIVLIKGWLRSIGFVTREKYDVKEIIDNIISGNMKIINRNKGSGSRQLLEYIIYDEAKKRNIPPDKIRSNIKGYDKTVYTHIEVAEAVSSGRADVGIAIKWAASAYNLYFNRLKWENFDIVTSKTKIKDKFIKELVETIKSNEFMEIVRGMKGYKYPKDVGEIFIF